MSEDKKQNKAKDLDGIAEPLNDELIQKNRPPRRAVVLRTIFNVTVSLVLAVSILVTGVLGVCAYLFRDMRLDVHFSDKNEDLGITDEIIEQLPKENNIINIALFGIDNYKKITDNKKRVKGRSDSIIVLSIDSKNKTVKLTSILRDSWVPVERSSGTKNYKINTAYAYGGAQLAVKTLNQNFGLDIKDYASVSLFQLSTIIDYIGGIDITITEKERIEINKGGVGGVQTVNIDKPGFVHLDGIQAATYATIRYIDGDDYRAKRHQKVLSALLETVKKKSITEYPALLQKILGQIETSMTYDEIIEYTYLVADSELKVETTIIPGSNVAYKRGVFSDTRGGWVWKYDLTEATEFIHKWIYGEEEEEIEDTATDNKDGSASAPSDKSDSTNKTTSAPQSEGQQ